ncbi:BnaC04g25070D [Brassica napus]|uniref:BnaC04g25070D protein n=1 Tax=Brassica napus TaxID=3708 RepID=A0A078I167_BRANA|nr:BnaC04g25070D [Brassica napus]
MGYVSAPCSSGLTFPADPMMLCSEIYDSQSLLEPQESVEIKRFCEDICKLILRWYMFNNYQFLLNQFSYKVVSEIDMFSMRVLHWVLS